MRTQKAFIRILTFFILLNLSNAETRDLIRITNAHRNDVRNIEETGAWVNYVDRSGVVAEATLSQQERLKDRGFTIEIITPKISDIYENNFTGSDGRYLTYAEFRDTMATIARNNPHICKLETLGLSYGGNLILMMKISDNPEIHENEPAVHFEGAIHGDEKIGWAITFELLKYLVNRYNSDSVVTRLVNSREIYLLPMYNPDGYIANSRYNGNNVDLNRNWGWMWGDEINPGTSPFSEPENRAVLEHIWRQPFVIFVSYHSGTTFISHPWSYCYSYQNTIPELNLIQFLSARYDRWTHYTYGQGADSMYPINGSTKDFDYGYGMMGWSIEVHTQKTPPASEIEPTFNLNLPAILELIHHADKGIHGTVTDAITGEPVHCQIWISPANWLSYNHPELGDFHRFYLPGTYSLTLRAPGYLDTTVENIVVPDIGDSAVTVTVQLTPDHSAPLFAFRHIYNSFVNPATNRTHPVRAVGPRDNDGFLLDNGKNICLDMGKPIYDAEGTDLAVYCAAGSGSAQVQIANNWRGPWTTLGMANGAITEFDIGTVSLDSIRYVRLIATGQFYLDAIEGLRSVGVAQDASGANFLTSAFSVLPNPVRTKAVVSLNFKPDKPLVMRISDISGRVVQTLTLTTHQTTWKAYTANGQPLPAGIYFATIPGIESVRVVVLK